MTYACFPYTSRENTRREQLTDHAAIHRWLIGHRILEAHIQPDNKVICGQSVSLHECRCWNLLVHFHQVNGSFSFCDGSVVTFEGFPEIIRGDLRFTGSDITCMTGIHKAVKYVGRHITCNRGATHILGLLLIQGVQRISVDDNGPIDDIVNKHLRSKDVISCQDELIDAGFIEQAKL